MKEKKERKKYERPTTVRFTTDEAKVLLMGMNYAVNRDIFSYEGVDTIQKAGKIINRLKDRIEKERQKKDKVVVSMMGGESENGTGD
jgi:hypothetical protein